MNVFLYVKFDPLVSRVGVSEQQMNCRLCAAVQEVSICLFCLFFFLRTKLDILWSSFRYEMDLKQEPRMCEAAGGAVLRPLPKLSFFCLLLYFMIHECRNICVSAVKLAGVCAQQEVGVAQGPPGCFHFSRQMALPAEEGSLQGRKGRKKMTKTHRSHFYQTWFKMQMSKSVCLFLS